MDPVDPALAGVRAYLSHLDGCEVAVRTSSGGEYAGPLSCLLSGNVIFVGPSGAAPCIRIDTVESVLLLSGEPGRTG
ncbi:hypothetical protein [Cellulomonas wangsupingiae]|uniref:Uncharacterized protein n=1 Tax=Cellulomonas wangsupingiae TaxID=2968085 RepID=A0ABY5K684_9CELL|nr:hypothetical protein [Cellulomonas wangsupingiae]MCC2334283.1 hypothetical protein [Cellulomonas wangsupingiae]UUI65959.1 hypothetical protein NP075_04280 [Cellulomonas wangsupingiae]